MNEYFQYKYNLVKNIFKSIEDKFMSGLIFEEQEKTQTLSLISKLKNIKFYYIYSNKEIIVIKSNDDIKTIPVCEFTQRLLLDYLK